MTRGRKPAKVKGVAFRKDRGVWTSAYRVNGKLVRKSHGTRDEAKDWIDEARGIRSKEGVESLPTSARVPLMTKAEKEWKAIEDAHANAVTVGQLCDNLKDHIAKHPSQYKDQVNPPRRLDRIKADLGNRIAADLKPKEIEVWLDGLANTHVQKGKGKPLADASVNRYRVMLSAAYKRGIRDENVKENPVRSTSQRKVSNGVIRWLKPDEEKAIREAISKRIEEASTHGRLGEDRKTLDAKKLFLVKRKDTEHKQTKYEEHHWCEFVISLQTGMRQGEQYSLTWSEIDFKHKTIHVRESKNGTERYIPMLPEVIKAFRTLQRLELKRKDRAVGQPNQSPEDCCFALANPKKWWAAVLHDARVKKYRWHDNRHTFCSRLVQAGKSLKVVQELAGHRDIKMTARYAHLDHGSKMDALIAAFVAA